MHQARFILAAIATLALPFAAHAQLDHATEAQLDETIRSVVQSTGVPSAEVGIVKDGKVAYVKAFGDARLSTASTPSRIATPEMHYAIGSNSKQFTAACVLLLQQQGKLKLDDPVSTWFPELTRSHEVTLRNLLTHTSGYSDYAPQDYTIPAWTKPVDPLALVHEWAEKPLDFDPGTKWQYSNTNFVLAGLIVEKVSGVRFHDFLWQNILKPLQMSDVLDLDYDRAKMEPTGYKRNALAPVRPAIPEAKGWYFADGQLAMPVRTLLVWDISLLQRSLLQTQSYDTLFQEQKLSNGEGSHYALGLSVESRRGVPVISHTGEVAGFVSSNSIVPAQNLAVAVLTNQDASSAASLISNAVMEQLLKPAAENNATPAEATVQQIKTILESFQQGKIDRSLFTSDANFYFSQDTIDDFHSSLQPLGKLQSVTLRGSRLRGGMQFRVYLAQFEHKQVSVSTYWTTDGHLEQFLVEAR